MSAPSNAIAFENGKRIASGPLADVALAVRRHAGRAMHEGVQIFDAVSGWLLHLDLTGSEKDISARYAAPGEKVVASPVPDGGEPQRGPGRPKLGVVAREVTLLPRHWDWLSAQPGGASVALRRLVEEARKTHQQSDNLRARQEAAYRFLSAMAGDWRNFEESTRALFAGDAMRFGDLTESWPTDVRDHARQLAFPAAPPPKT
jgi:hypothetical protein